VRELVEAGHERARTLLSTHRAALEQIAERLLERESLQGEELAELLKAVADESGRPGPALKLSA
ncbi:MAG: hypothetical protein HYY04_18835, partial [Chloroflexi bacterium]|nr:hypothetical protein [Chloroflexota bacterium]